MRLVADLLDFIKSTSVSVTASRNMTTMTERQKCSHEDAVGEETTASMNDCGARRAFGRSVAPWSIKS